MHLAGLTVGPATHLDHLGIFCELLDIPLFVPDEELVETAATFYPNLDVRLTTLAHLTSPELLAAHDAVIFTSKVWACETVVFVKEFYNLKTRVIYCPHGNSDKGHSLKDELSYPANDIELYYGPHMFDHLKKIRVLETASATMRLGNFRFHYYKKHQPFYDSLTQEKVFSRLRKGKETILYAPTWNTKESPTSFFDSCEELIHALPEEYNLIVKLHPFLEKNFPAKTHKLIGKHAGKPHALFLEYFPPIYPLLAQCSLYLGDFSSIGYDFLTFNRPLFFFNPLKAKTQSHFLHQCGMTIPDGISPFAFIHHNLEENTQALQEARKNLYSYTFGEEKTISQIKNNLAEILIPAPHWT